MPAACDEKAMPIHSGLGLTHGHMFGVLRRWAGACWAGVITDESSQGHTDAFYGKEADNTIPHATTHMMWRV